MRCQNGYGKFLGFVWENNVVIFLWGLNMQRKIFFFWNFGNLALEKFWDYFKGFA